MAEKRYFLTSKKTGNKLFFGIAKSVKIPGGGPDEYGVEILKDATEINVFVDGEGIPEYNPDGYHEYAIEFVEPMRLVLQDTSSNRTALFTNTLSGAVFDPAINVNTIDFPFRAANQHVKTFLPTADSQFAAIKGKVTIAGWHYEYEGTSSPILAGYKGRYSNKSYHKTLPVLNVWVDKDLSKFFQGIPEKDPTNYGPDSGTGGGNGDFDGTSDDIPIPALPTLSAVESGFLSLYAPSEAQMFALANYMWGKDFNADAFKKLFADPMDVIIGVSIVPCAVPTDGPRNVKIGFVDTGISMNHASTQYVDVDCGTVSIKNYFGSALDYSPYTRFSIYLPYIGTRTLSTEDIMGKDIQVKYHVDLLSGTLTAFVASNGTVLYSFSGSCATQIPITSQNWGSAIASAVGLASAGITAFSTGGGSLLAGATAGAAYGAMNTQSMKPSVQRAGAVSGAAGMLGIQTPYLIAELPIQSRAKDYNHYHGLPSNITAKLSDLTGYTVVDTIHLDIAGALDPEVEELEQILKGGVIL